MFLYFSKTHWGGLHADENGILLYFLYIFLFIFFQDIFMFLYFSKTHWGGLHADENGEALKTGLACSHKLLPQPRVLQSQIGVYQFTQHLQSTAPRAPMRVTVSSRRPGACA